MSTSPLQQLQHWARDLEHTIDVALEDTLQETKQEDDIQLESEGDTMVDSDKETPPAPQASTVLKWNDTVAAISKGVPVPQCGGIFKDVKGGEDKVTFVPFVGTDPDRKINCWSWDQKEDEWTISSAAYKDTWTNNQGPVHAGQFRPTDVKGQKAAKEKCTTYSGTPFSNPEEKGARTNLKTYKDMCCRHMIKNGMWDIFNMPDPRDPAKKWDLFYHLGRFPLRRVSAYIDTIRRTGDKYVIDNLDWRGEYLLATLDSTLLTKVLNHVDVTSSGPEVLSATLLVIHACNSEIMERVRTKLANIKLTDYPGQNIDKCCADQLVLLQRLDDAGYLKVEHLSLVTRTLKKCTSREFESWALKQHERVQDYRELLEIMDDDNIPADQKVTYDSLIKRARAMYKQLIDANDWSPLAASDQPEPEPTLPAAGYQANDQGGHKTPLTSFDPTAFATVIAESVANAVLKASSSNNQTGQQAGTGKRQCHRCGSSNHLIKDCDKPENKTTGYWGPPSGNPDKATKNHRGRIMKYCSVCPGWRFHHAPGHEAWMKRKKEREAKAGGSSDSGGARASLATEGGTKEDDAEDDFVCFI